MLVDIGEPVRIEATPNQFGHVFHWKGDVVRVDDHGVRITNVFIGDGIPISGDDWHAVEFDQVLTWKNINRLSVG